MKKLLLFITAMLVFSSLMACNTIKGIGKDIEQGGEAIQRVAK